MSFLNDPFFWALTSMFGLVGACAVVGSKKVGRNTLLGLFIVTIFDLGRFILALPLCDQPHFNIGGWHGLLGGTIFVIGGYLGLAPCLLIRPVNVAEKGMDLQTTRFYGLVRNPIYLGEVLWCLGWAIMFRSIIGVALVPLWWLGLLILILIEEESLERSLGQTYLEYKKRVRGRIIPGLPI
jgi:protein-S-isoprenylcysteine O-methyltransferase Ste14